MAKVNQTWLSGATGKAGGKVFYKSAGKTVMRDLVIPKNPQTQLQMAQRIIFATVTQAAKFLRPIVNHSFETKSYGQASVNHFVQQNIARLRSLASLDFQTTPSAAQAHMFTTTKGVSQLIPNSYLVADGSLASPRVSIVKGGNGDLTMQFPALALALTTYTVGEAQFRGVTVADLLRAVFGVSTTSDQLSLVAIARTQDQMQYVYDGSSELGYQIASTGANTRRVIFCENADLTQMVAIASATGEVLENAGENIVNAFEGAIDAAKSDAALVAFIADVLGNYAFTVAAGGARVTAPAVNDNIDGLYVYDPAEGGGHAYAAGIVRSQYVDKKWRRSRCFLTLATPSQANNFGLLWSITLQAWFRGDLIAENADSFLNEGGEANEIGTDF